LKKYSPSLKEIALFRGAGKKLSSEEYFGLPVQPENTCPLIDDVIGDIKGSIKEIEDIISDIPSESEDPCDGCDSRYGRYHKSPINKNISYLEDMRSILYDWTSLLVTEIADLEKLRKLCSDYRNYGDYIKEQIWDFLDDINKNPEEAIVLMGSYLTDFEKHKKEKPKNWMTADDYDVFSKMFLKTDSESSDNCSNEECSNAKKNNVLYSYLDERDRYSINVPREFKKAFNNLQNIEDWATCIEDCFGDLLANDNWKIEQDKSQFEQDFNQEKTNDYLKRWYDFRISNSLRSFAGVELTMSKISNQSVVETWKKIRQDILELTELDIRDLTTHSDMYDSIRLTLINRILDLNKTTELTDSSMLDVINELNQLELTRCQF
jgi:hypothetical protein